jgi:hypothetical protein
MNSNNYEKQLLLMQPHFLQGVATPIQELPTHQWGIFGEYEYLGAGTPYTMKREAGVKPRNDLDKVAMYHDSQYRWTSQHNFLGTALSKNIQRGIADYGAGAAMWTAAINPWSDLGFKERVLGIIAGEGLMMQAAIRISPPTWIAGVGLDLIFY